MNLDDSYAELIRKYFYLSSLLWYELRVRFFNLCLLIEEQIKESNSKLDSEAHQIPHWLRPFSVFISFADTYQERKQWTIDIEIYSFKIILYIK